uniref:Uncharacterized protein n=1 Tax=Oryza meridionalis TaxID=40149 RepID=A0A0E0DRA4_9ORYZ
MGAEGRGAVVPLQTGPFLALSSLGPSVRDAAPSMAGKTSPPPPPSATTPQPPSAPTPRCARRRSFNRMSETVTIVQRISQIGRMAIKYIDDVATTTSIRDDTTTSVRADPTLRTPPILRPRAFRILNYAFYGLQFADHGLYMNRMSETVTIVQRISQIGRMAIKYIDELNWTN